MPLLSRVAGECSSTISAPLVSTTISLTCGICTGVAMAADVSDFTYSQGKECDLSVIMILPKQRELTYRQLSIDLEWSETRQIGMLVAEDA